MNEPTDDRSRAPRKIVYSIIGVLVITLIASGGWFGFAWFQARQWEQRLTSTADINKVRTTLYEMLHSNNRFAKDILQRHAQRSDQIAYDPRHQALLLIDAATNQPLTFSPDFSSESPDVSAQFEGVTLVESVPEASIFAVTNQRDQNVTLFVTAGNHLSFVGPLTADELEQWKQAGVWKSVVAKQAGSQ